jgi:hypothetical protein
VQSTRNTSIRTRKTLGEDSLVNSMSREERGEVPDGMADVIHYESPERPALWHSVGPKKAPDAPISGQGGNPQPRSGS